MDTSSKLARCSIVRLAWRRWRSGRRDVFGAWTIPVVVALAYTLLFQFTGFVGRDFDQERWWVLEVGRRILDSGAVRRDFGAGSMHPEFRSYDYEWTYALATAVFVRAHLYWVFACVQSLALAMPLFYVAGECVRRRISTLSSTLLLCVVGFALYRWQQLRAEVFIPVIATWLLCALHSRRPFWAILPVVVWSNIHGSFPLALVVVAAFVRNPRGLAMLVVCALGTLVNPTGFGIWHAIFEESSAFSTMPLYVREWMPTYRDVGGLFELLFLAYPFALAALHGKPRRPLHVVDAIVGFAFLGMGLHALKFLRVFAIFGVVRLLGFIRERRAFSSRAAFTITLPFFVVVVGSAALNLWTLPYDVWEPTFQRFDPPSSLQAWGVVSRLREPACFDDWSEANVYEGRGGQVNFDGRVDAYDYRRSMAAVGLFGDDAAARILSAEPCRIAIVRSRGIASALARRGWSFRASSRYWMFLRR